GVSVFIDHLIEDLTLTRSEVSIAYLIGTMLGALTLPSVGRWIDRVGVRPAITIIGVAFSVALVAMGGVANFITLALGFTFIRLLGQGALSLASTVAVTHWFERRRGMALGIYMTAVTILIGLVPVLLNVAINATTWRTAWLIAAAVIFVTVVPIGRFGIISYPSDIGEVPDGHVAVAAATEVHVPVPSYTRGEAMRTVRFWIVLSMVAVMGAWATALNFHQISLLGEAGLSASAAALMFLPQVVGGATAALVFGALTDRIKARWLIPIAMGFLATAQLLVPILSPGILVFLYSTTLGMSGGSTRSISAALLPKWFGTAHIGSISAVVTFAGVVGSAVGPVTFSIGRDILGGYGSTVAWLSILPIGVAVAALSLLGRDRTD
ncbi:MAG: MFS transporter, partial [Acidimicrobiia bacterium]|nr:MFS transporter [Acidimicrobiia bacterium]